jgi:hypothetical protein
MKQLVMLMVAVILMSCSKPEDFSYLNADRRNCGQVCIISKRYDVNWKALPDSIRVVPWNQNSTMCESDFDWFKGNLNPDNLKNRKVYTFKNVKWYAGRTEVLSSSCSIDKIDSAFRNEIRIWATTK